MWTLDTLIRIPESVEVSSAGEGETLKADGEASLIHHAEHDFHAFILLANQVTKTIVVFSEIQRAGCGTVKAKFLFHRHRSYVVIHKSALHRSLLWNKKNAYSFCPSRRAFDTRKNQVNDVLSQVVVSGCDENL